MAVTANGDFGNSLAEFVIRIEWKYLTLHLALWLKCLNHAEWLYQEQLKVMKKNPA